MKPRMLAILLLVGTLLALVLLGAEPAAQHLSRADSVLAAPLAGPLSDAPWGSNVKVNDSSTNTQYVPSIAVDASGNAYAVWEDRRAGSYDDDIYFSYRPAGGSWGTNVKVNDDAGVARQEQPSIAVDPGGNAYAVWLDHRVDWLDVYFSYRPAGGSWGQNTRVNDVLGSVSGKPSIAVDRSGNAYAVWTDSRGSGNRIYFSYRPAGGSWGSNVQVNDSAGRSPGIAVDWSGNAYAVWAKEGGGDVYFSYRPAGGSWGTSSRVNDEPGQAFENYEVSIAVDPSGNAHVLWEDFRNDLDGDIYSSYRPAGGSWTGNVRVNDDGGAGWQYYQCVAVDPGGNAYAAWADGRNDDDEIYFSYRPAGGQTCPAGNTPIVLIHGWHGPDDVEQSQLRHMRDWLEADGCTVYYATGINANQTLEEGAFVLKEYISDVKEEAHVDKVVIIGYSRGGLSARAYVESDRELYNDDVSRVIMLGTPNAGANISLVELYLKAHLFKGIWEYPGGDLLSTYELLPETMVEFNARYRNPQNIPYYLIGGDGNPVIKDPPNDLLVRVDSVHSAPGDRNVDMQTHDVHGYDWKALNRRSYVYPRETYDACIRPSLAGSPASQDCFVASGSSLGLRESTEPIVHTPYQSDIISAGGSITHSIAMTATAQSRFHLVWSQGDLDLALLDPLGTTIDPTYAESSPGVDFISFEPDTTINYNTYGIGDTVAGTWTLTVTANYTEPVDVAFTTFATLEPTVDLDVSTDKALYDLDEAVALTATLSYGFDGLAGADVEALIGRPDLVTDTLTLQDDGAHGDGLADDGIYGNTYVDTDVGGPYVLFVTAEGMLDGVTYARGDEVEIQVSPETGHLTGNYSDYPEDADNNGRQEYLVADVEVDVTTAGNFLLSGILLGPGDEEIASTVHPVSLALGTQTVPLRFEGDLIYRSGVDGPYTLTQVFLMDSTGLPIKLDEAYDAWVTAAYDHTKFGLNEVTGLPLVLKTY